MCARMRRHPWYVEHQHVDSDAGLALGHLSLGFVNAGEQPVWSADRGIGCIMDGELYDAGEARRQIALQDGESSGANHADILLAAYQQGGAEALRDLEGSFAAAIWDGVRRRLVLLGDRFGMRPLYYTKLPGRLLFASSMQALMTDPDVSRLADWRGIAQFFCFGQYFGNDTSIEEIEVLPAASCLTYYVDDDRIEVAPYWRLEEQVTPLGGGPALLDEIDDRFCRAVNRRLGETEHLGLALSGGLDARSILGVIDHQQVKLKTINYGIEGSLDHRCAAEMAKIVGCPHVNHVLDAQFLANYRRHLEEMVRLTDGQYLSQCIIMPTLPVYRELGIEVLLRGHAGELMHMRKAYAYSLNREALAIRTNLDLESWLFRHLQSHMLSGLSAPLFKDVHQGDVEKLALDSLRGALQPAARIEPPLERIWYLFVTQRLRRETALSLAKFGSVVEVRVPFLDGDLVPLLLSVPPKMKLGETIERHILAKHRPEFLGVVNSNTGTRIGAGPLRRKLSTLRMRALAKLGVKGYQPYERLGLWLRRELAEMVNDILLGEACLDRGIFRPDTVRQIIEQHQTKQRNHTYLLMAMMTFELGQRRLLDEEPSTTTIANQVARP